MTTRRPIFPSEVSIQESNQETKQQLPNMGDVLTYVKNAQKRAIDLNDIAENNNLIAKEKMKEQHLKKLKKGYQ